MKITTQNMTVVKIEPCCPKMAEHYGHSFKKLFDLEDKIFFISPRDDMLPAEIICCPFCGSQITFLHTESPLYPAFNFSTKTHDCPYNHKEMKGTCRYCHWCGDRIV